MRMKLSSWEQLDRHSEWTVFNSVKTFRDELGVKDDRALATLALASALQALVGVVRLNGQELADILDARATQDAESTSVLARAVREVAFQLRAGEPSEAAAKCGVTRSTT